jgi:hypothetical protein
MSSRCADIPPEIRVAASSLLSDPATDIPALPEHDRQKADPAARTRHGLFRANASRPVTPRIVRINGTLFTTGEPQTSERTTESEQKYSWEVPIGLLTVA